MPVYQYLALDPQGLEQQGSVHAGDARAAAELLRARQLYVVRLESPDAQPGTEEARDVRDVLAELWPVGGQHLALFFRQMGMMLRAGLTILQALDTARSTCGSRRLAVVIGRVGHAIEGGTSLSCALEAHPRYFARLVVQLVKSAEASGELDIVMERIAEDLERNIELKRQFLTSLTYPAVVVATAIGVAAFLVLIVVPEFAKFFAKTGRSLPPVTQSLVDVASFFKAWGYWIAAGLAALGMGLAMAWRRPETRRELDRLVLRTPVIGKLVLAANIAQFAWSSAMLLRSGVTLLETLRITAAIAGNGAVSGAIARAADSVLSGRDLASSLDQAALPPLVSQLAAVGEKTGALDAVMQAVGDYFQKLLQLHIKRLTALVEPVLIALIGGMVGYVYYAFFQALFSVAG